MSENENCVKKCKQTQHAADHRLLDGAPYCCTGRVGGFTTAVCRLEVLLGHSLLQVLAVQGLLLGLHNAPAAGKCKTERTAFIVTNISSQAIILKM